MPNIFNCMEQDLKGMKLAPLTAVDEFRFYLFGIIPVTLWAYAYSHWQLNAMRSKMFNAERAAWGDPKVRATGISGREHFKSLDNTGHTYSFTLRDPKLESCMPVLGWKLKFEQRILNAEFSGREITKPLQPDNFCGISVGFPENKQEVCRYWTPGVNLEFRTHDPEITGLREIQYEPS